MGAPSPYSKYIYASFWVCEGRNTHAVVVPDPSRLSFLGNHRLHPPSYALLHTTTPYQRISLILLILLQIIHLAHPGIPLPLLPFLEPPNSHHHLDILLHITRT
mmetsp:Transcript_20488/g.41755  ORF Transcript_20488/g.41755 Transcript_20488/m.41755 type:complete len:104 (-) Transcript_20488:1054-1365(-)